MWEENPFVSDWSSRHVIVVLRLAFGLNIRLKPAGDINSSVNLINLTNAVLPWNTTWTILDSDGNVAAWVPSSTLHLYV